MRGAGWAMLHVWREQYPESGQVRILCLGDSFTYGVGAERGKSYPRQLQERLDRDSKCKAQVINRGVPGLNSGYIRAHFEEDLLKYRPHIVLFMAGINNHWNATDAFTDDDDPTVGERVQAALSEFRLYKLVRFNAYRFKHRKSAASAGGESGDSIAVQESIYENEDSFAEGHVVVENGRRKVIRYQIESREFQSPVASRRLVRDVQVMHGIAKRYGTDFIVMTYPNPMPIHPELLRVADALNIPVIDHKAWFYTRIPEQDMPDYFYEENFLWSHPNARGYAVMADRIVKELPRYCQSLKPCLPVEPEHEASE
jgi:lysophospholipase L1-like esterase